MEALATARHLTHLAEGVEYVVEVDQDLALCDLGDVVHGLAGIVSYTGVLIGEASEDWRHNDFEVPRKLLESRRKASVK
jgi:translation initiation factor RLI1